MPRRNRFLTETYNKMLTQEIVAREKYYMDPEIARKLKEYLAKKKEKNVVQAKPKPVMAKEASNTGDVEALDNIKKIIENSFVDSIQIQTHYGNIDLPIREVWVQDEVLKISVAGQPE